MPRKILDGIPLRKLRCYTMIGYDAESLRDAEWRNEQVLEAGFMPFCQLYQPDDGVKVYPEEWRNVRRKWSRPAAYMGKVVAFGESQHEHADVRQVPIPVHSHEENEA